jgi:hypothetical protein
MVHNQEVTVLARFLKESKEILDVESFVEHMREVHKRLYNGYTKETNDTKER